MALSQILCLDDNHVNPRTHESKPEFLYSEDQRLALEAFLREGREAFVKYLGTHGLRGFLSDPELDTLAGAVEPYDPGLELFPEDAEEDEPPPLSEHYWPDLSDTSIPQMDLGWPESISYRGVTRTTVYTQPPMEDQAHIKEVVRKMIAQAQKVIAVVMDVFTDVDIFRDLLDAGFKRKVSVYILLERATLPHFRSMCQRADMHAGHLKHLRVRCTHGSEFYTRSCTRVRGRMGHRFMFIDGDKAVSGSYSFTWMSSRLDRNLITVTTGQAVETFDRLFCILYGSSSSVDLRQVATKPEPELEPLPQQTAVPLPSAAIARKMYNPKYALVALSSPSPAPSDGPKETQNPEESKNPETKKRRRRRGSKEAIQEAPPTHPGLILEKVNLIPYLPTWPEPDPSSDVIGFINIRDSKKPTQVHLQRSEMFQTSQAIKFSSPFSMPKEILPEVAKPRQLTTKHEEMNKLKPAQDKTKAEESAIGRAQPTQLNAQPGDIKSKAEAPGQKPPTSEPKFESKNDTIKTLNAENKLHSNTHNNLDAGHNGTPHLNAHTPHQSSNKASTPNTERPSHTTQNATVLPGSNTKNETNSNTHRAVVYRTNTLETSSTKTSHLCHPADITEPHTQTKTDSHTQAVQTQPQNSSEMTPDSHKPSSPTSATCSQSVSSTSENNHVSVATSTTTGGCSPLSSLSSSSSVPPLISSSTTPNPHLPSSSTSPPSTSTPPIPKPRTVQLVIKGGVTGDNQKLPEFNVVRKPEPSTGPPVVQNVASEKVPETVPALQDVSGSMTGAQKDVKNAEKSPQQSFTSQQTKNEEAVGRHDDREGMQLVAGNNLEAKSDVLITGMPRAESESSQEIIPKDVEPKTLTSKESTLTPQTDCEAEAQTEIKAPERALTGCDLTEVPNEKSENVTEHKTYLARACVPQRISYNNTDALETVDSLKSPTHSPVSATHISKDSEAADTQGQQVNPAHHTDGIPNTAKHNTHSTFQEQIPKARGSTHTPERPLHLHLSDIHTPDFRSAERESRSLTALIRTPTPDGFLPRTPTPDSRTHTPDPRSHTPDFRTPTPDGYVSALSTASEDYYECSDSPSPSLLNHEAMEDHIDFTLTNTSYATTSPLYMNFNSCAASLGIPDSKTSSNETLSSSGPAGVSSSSPLLEKKAKMWDGKETTNEENGREEGENGSVPERTEGVYKGTERRGSEEAKRTADHLKQGENSTETEENKHEAQPQAPKRKRVINQSEAVDGGVTPGELTNDRTEPKRLSTGDPQPQSSEGKRPDKEKAVDKASLGPVSVEKKDRPQLIKEKEGQKILHTPPKIPRGQQQNNGSSSPSRPPRPPRPISGNQSLGPRPWETRQPNQTESKVLHGNFQVLDNTSSPRRPPSRPPPPVAAGRKQAEVSSGQQSLLSRQPLAAQGRTRPGQSLNPHPYPKPQASFLHTHSNRGEQLQPHSQNQMVAQRETHWQEEARSPFSFTFSRLYNLKGLKDKVSKLPAQSKRGSASSPGQGRKSTS
ncbi:mucin-5AC-like [Epinephelus fuscoguttatus]|uniref:mucin-5AC-like n=1 Tax=Epinephelus fuscoguttatus TaxID=293821 RepID=UPI0020D1039A|nr:mucin-5AC-like [Epinephelus fuscoguttatus]